MSKYAIIVENDESEWNDLTGEYYHFPKRYLGVLEEGTDVIYYKGKMKNSEYRQSRLSTEPHYFGVAVIDHFYLDDRSTKGDQYASIKNFVEFEKAVPFKVDEDYLEVIPSNRKSNYWRDAVRKITKEEYETILDLAKMKTEDPKNYVESSEIEYSAIGTDDFISREEGKKKKIYSTRFERDPRLRQKALEIHGYNCLACGFHFEATYEKRGKKYIHVHHKKPISEYESPKQVNPAEDLAVLCPNCHAMVHRYREKTLTVEELKDLITI